MSRQTEGQCWAEIRFGELDLLQWRGLSQGSGVEWRGLKVEILVRKGQETTKKSPLSQWRWSENKTHHRMKEDKAEKWSRKGQVWAGLPLKAFPWDKAKRGYSLLVFRSKSPLGAEGLDGTPNPSSSSRLSNLPSERFSSQVTNLRVNPPP